MNIKVITRRLRYLTALVLVFLSMSALLNAQQLQLDFQNTPLKAVLKVITAQTGYDFVYSDALKNIDAKVTVSSKNEKPEQFFSRFFPTIGISYKIQGKQVSLSPKELASQSSNVNQATTPTQPNGKIKIKGKITDQLGQPIPGVSVVNLSDKTGVSSDFEGNYTLDVKVGDRISYTFIGYKKADILVTSSHSTRNNVIDIILEEDAVALESVAVIGYGNTQKIKDITGSIAHYGQQGTENSTYGFYCSINVTRSWQPV